MSTTDLLGSVRANRRTPSTLNVNRLCIAVALFGLVAFVAAFQYRGGLSEYDVYWMLVGILDGHATGRGTGGAMHYGLPISFGYYEAAYHLLSDRILSDPQRLIAAMNALGFVSSIVGLAALAAAITFAYGERAALVTTLLFGASPLYLDLSLSGHPILAASAAYFVGAALLFAKTRGVARFAVWSAATLALFVGLTMRAEVLIAFPWLVVARADTRSLGGFIKSALLQSVPPALAVALFFLAQRSYASPQAGGGEGALVDFLRQFYVLSNIGIGFAYILLGVGTLTLLAVAGTAVYAVSLAKKAAWRPLIEIVLGPATLVLPCLLLWMPNPVPVRHFLFLDVGVTLMVGIMVSRLNWSASTTIVTLLVCIVGNQVVIEAGRSPVLARFNPPYTNFPEARRTLTTAPLGFVWRHRDAMQQRHDAWDAQADAVRGTCNRHVIVLANERFTMIAPLFAGGDHVSFNWTKIGDFDSITATRSDGRVIDFIEPYHWWPRDVTADLLANPALNDAAIFAVPYAKSIYDRMPVPQSRLPKEGCDRAVGAG